MDWAIGRTLHKITERILKLRPPHTAMQAIQMVADAVLAFPGVGTLRGLTASIDPSRERGNRDNNCRAPE